MLTFIKYCTDKVPRTLTYILAELYVWNAAESHTQNSSLIFTRMLHRGCSTSLLQFIAGHKHTYLAGFLVTTFTVTSVAYVSPGRTPSN
jgi:hypothetical protein